MKTRIVKLNENQAATLALDLNNLLANFQVYYQNMRGLHWNIKGKNFFELHVKFEELYLDAQEKIDMIAERILTLEHTPLHTFKAYLEASTIAIGEGVSSDEDAVKLVVASIGTLLAQEIALLEKSGEMGDEGTNSMMSDFIAEQEKTLWMFKSWLN
jgi:starvation-inducible DNA-binding protein